MLTSRCSFLVARLSLAVTGKQYAGLPNLLKEHPTWVPFFLVWIPAFAGMTVGRYYRTGGHTEDEYTVAAVIPAQERHPRLRSGTGIHRVRVATIQNLNSRLHGADGRGGHSRAGTSSSTPIGDGNPEHCEKVC